MMQEVPFPVVGGTGGHRSTQFSDELTLNMYLDQSENGRRGAHDFPGLKSWSSGSGTDRGFHVMGATLYKISGQALEKIDASGARTTLGTVSGSDRAIFADDGTNLFFVCSSLIYRWDGTTLGTVTQSVVTSPSSIAYINQQFIITGSNGLFASSDVADGTTYNVLNYAGAEVNPDPLLRAYVYNQIVYMAGTRSIEPWYNSGTGNPPFSRQDSALMNIGIAGKHAITHTDNYLYWLSDDRQFTQAIGSSSRNITSTAVAHKVLSYSLVSDCIASTFITNGQTFVLWVFPGANTTLVYSETYEYWVELQSDTEHPGNRWYGNAAVRCYEKILVADHRNGNIYELDNNTYTDNGNTRLRIRTLPSINSQIIGRQGGRVIVGGIRISCQVGVGLATGQGVAPVLMCEVSSDGGHTWGDETHVSIGALGDYARSVDYDFFASGYDVRVRIKCSDPVYFSLFDAVVKLRYGGH